MQQSITDFIQEQIKLKNDKRHYAFFLLPKSTIKIAEGENTLISDKTCTTVHAEIAALEKIKKWRVCPKSVDLVVFSLKKNGYIGNGKPCNHCIYLLSLSKVKIKNVYYCRCRSFPAGAEVVGLKRLAPGADIVELKSLAPDAEVVGLKMLGVELKNINEIAPGVTIIKEKFSKFVNNIKFDKTFSKSSRYKCGEKVYYCNS